MDSRFIISAARPEQFPNSPGRDLPEVAFLGRSNVGKSSLLNALVGRPGLAFTSSKPGCTQLINFYNIGGSMMFADLPGYGFARVPPQIQREWKKLIEHYLERRKELALSVVLLDARRGWMESDLELKQWLESRGRKYIVAATKVDKLKSQSEQHRAMKALQSSPEQEVIPVSVITGRGLKELWHAIQRIKD